MLVQSPLLQQAIDSALKSYHNTMYGHTPTQDNWQTDPVTREQQARTQLASDLMNAITSFIENTIFEIVPGGVITVGSPTTQSTVAPSIVTKI